MRPNYDVREVYSGDGIQDEFTFDFKIINLQNLKVLLLDNLQATVWEVRATDTTYFTTVLDGENGGVLTMVAPPPDDYTIIILNADDEPTQPSKYVADDRYTMRKIENTFDVLSGQIQRIRYLLDRSLKIPEKWFAAFNTELPEMISSAVPMVNEDGDAFTLVPRSEFKGDPGTDGSYPQFFFQNTEPITADAGDIWVNSDTNVLSKYISGDWVELGSLGGSGVPVGGETGDFIEKLSDTDGDAEWKSATYEGIGRFGVWSSVGLKDTLDKIIAIAYSPPTISLGASGSGTLREKGDAVTSSTLSANVVKRSYNIGEVRFYRNPSTLLDTQTSGGAIPSGGISSYNWTGSFSDNVTFRAETDDLAGPLGGPTTVQATATFSFVYPYYTGVGAAGLGAGVAALTKRIINSTANRQEILSPNGSQKMYFAYPSSYGALTSILDVNSFNTIGDWTRTTNNITGLDGNAISYYIYEFNNFAVAGIYQYNFIK